MASRGRDSPWGRFFVRSGGKCRPSFLQSFEAKRSSEMLWCLSLAPATWFSTVCPFVGCRAAQQGAKRGQARGKNFDAANDHESGDPAFAPAQPRDEGSAGQRAALSKSLTAAHPGVSHQPRTGDVGERRSLGPEPQHGARGGGGGGTRRFSGSRSDCDQEEEHPSGGFGAAMGARRHPSRRGAGDASRRQAGFPRDDGELGRGSNKPAASSVPAGLTARGLDAIRNDANGGTFFLRGGGAQPGRARVTEGDGSWECSQWRRALGNMCDHPVRMIPSYSGATIIPSMGIELWLWSQRRCLGVVEPRRLGPVVAVSKAASLVLAGCSSASSCRFHGSQTSCSIDFRDGRPFGHEGAAGFLRAFPETRSCQATRWQGTALAVFSKQDTIEHFLVLRDTKYDSTMHPRLSNSVLCIAACLGPA